ncbi:MAG TPA: hypothetical protein VH475_17965 [Tepidisphaeraceae bacterium]
MLILRLKRCERALAGGRLDEAARLIRSAGATAHRRGQELLDQLVAALVERGRQHLGDGRLGPAEADCQEAAHLAGNTPEIAQLRMAIEDASDERRRGCDQRRETRAAVQQLVRQGEFTLAGEAAGNDPAAVAQIEVRRASLERVIADVNSAMGRDDWEGALQHLLAAGDSPRLARQKRQVGARVAEEVRRQIELGRLDAAVAIQQRASSLSPVCGELDDVRRQIEQFRSAGEFVRSGRYREALDVLERLAPSWRKAAWLASAMIELQRACEGVEALRRGPLALFEVADMTVAHPARPISLATVAYGEPVPAIFPKSPQSPRPSARRFLLHVDGAGSFVVLQGDRIEVGPISGSKPPDLPLITTAGAPSLTLSRAEEDYFLSASAPVAVNDRAMAAKLLASGDRISIGPRCRVTFRRPNAASATAVLEVGGARLPWGSVREVLLMDREIVLGASTAAHVRVRECPAPVILQASSDGGLLCRADETVVVDGVACGRTAKVNEGGRVVVGPLSFVICRE